MTDDDVNNKITSDANEVKNHFAGHWQDFYSTFLELQTGNGNELKAVCPFHEDSDPSLSINNETGEFYCFGCQASGDAFTFYGRLKGISSFDGIVRGIAADFGISGNGKKPGPGRIIKTYDYVNAEGVLLYQSVRMEPKAFRQRQPDGKGGWVWNMKDVDRVLYRLPEVLQAGLVVVCEGEKDIDKLFSLGLPATTNVGGAGKWQHEYSVSLKGKDVGILPDNDEPGRNHAQKVANAVFKYAKSVKVIELPGLPEKGDVSDWIDAGGTKEALLKMVEDAPLWLPTAGEPEGQEEAEPDLFPRGPFPWGVLPVVIAESLKQLARSCATSATSLPGAAIAILASVIGRVVSICPKLSWAEPLIFWLVDIRPSGEGKTHAARALCKQLYIAQKKADDANAEANMKYLLLSKKERREQGIETPPRPRGYFLTAFTLEGIHSENSGHGGCVAVQDEVSGVITGQGQYKGGGGNDREAMLALNDGKPARIVRAGWSKTIRGARVSIFGGCQNQVWKWVFTNEDGKILQVDGTLFRFLPVYEGEAFHPLTMESWSEENQKVWESTVSAAMNWADTKFEAGENHNLIFSSEAQEVFIDWRNEFFRMKPDLPEMARGFVPKLVAYAIRFSGIIYLMDCFSRGDTPGKVLTPIDVRKGIKVAEFYLGHILQSIRGLKEEGATLPFETTDQVIHVARTLDALRGDVENGLLAVGFIQEAFNRDCAEGLHVSSAKAMGAILRACGLTMALGNNDANGRRRVKCLQWDEKTEIFIETKSPKSPSLQNEENQTVTHGDIENAKSPKSPENIVSVESMETLETWRKQSLHEKPIENTTNGDMETLETSFQGSIEKINPMFDFNITTTPTPTANLDWSF